MLDWLFKVVFDVASKFFKIRPRVVTITHKTALNVSKAKYGTFEFDYSNHNGVFTIGEGDYQFDTKWSKASNRSIHAYNDSQNIDKIALIKDNVDLQNIKSVDGDFSSRCRCPKIGQSIIWKNVHGKYAITKIVQIKDDSRGDDSDWLVCEYIILC